MAYFGALAFKLSVDMKWPIIMSVIFGACENQKRKGHKTANGDCSNGMRSTLAIRCQAQRERLTTHITHNYGILSPRLKVPILRWKKSRKMAFLGDNGV